MKSLSTIFILAAGLLFSCSHQEEVTPSALAPEPEKSLLGSFETPQGHHVSFYEFAPGSVGTVAVYPAGDDAVSMEIQDLLGSGIAATDLYKKLAGENINRRYLQKIEAAEKRLAELRRRGASNDIINSEKELTKTTDKATALPSVTFPVLPWCPYPLEYSKIKCQTAPTSPGTLPLVTWYPAVQKDFRVRLYIYADTGGGYLRIDRRDCGYEYCNPGVPVFDLIKLNQNGTAQVIDFNLNNATPDSYYFRGEGFSTGSYSGSKINMGVGVDKITFGK